MTSGKSFFLGLGAAKCGTSWLYDYLEGHPQFAGAPIKEMHILGSPDFDSYVAAVRDLPWHRFAGRRWLKENLYKAWLRRDKSRYFRLFERLLDGDDARATGEISPSYVKLSAEKIRYVKSQFDARGIRTVAGLLMRDPVERIYSAERFDLWLREQNRYRRTLNIPATERMEAYLASDPAPLYAPILKRMNACFDQSEQFVELYENLFSQGAVDRLTTMLGLEPHPGNFGQRVNALPLSRPVPEELTHRIARHHVADYAAACDCFGRDTIAAAWPSLAFSGI